MATLEILRNVALAAHRPRAARENGSDYRRGTLCRVRFLSRMRDRPACECYIVSI
jgi:hypothetical protein